MSDHVNDEGPAVLLFSLGALSMTVAEEQALPADATYSGRGEKCVLGRRPLDVTSTLARRAFFAVLEEAESSAVVGFRSAVQTSSASFGIEGSMVRAVPGCPLAFRRRAYP